MKSKIHKIRAVLNDSTVSVQRGNGESANSPVSNCWLWILDAIAFPEENEIEIIDVRKHRQSHQRDMSTSRKESKETSRALVWEQYIKYLFEWARNHSKPTYYGMSPADFGEWLESENTENAPARPMKCSVCGCEMVWKHPHDPEHLVESSCYIGTDICYDCMSDHCAYTNCLGCRKGVWPNCEFRYLKVQSNNNPPES